MPSRDLIDRVASYIDKRRLITARVNVGKPRLVPVLARADHLAQARRHRGPRQGAT